MDNTWKSTPLWQAADAWLAGLAAFIPGDTTDAKIEIAANVLGILGFALSILLLIGGIVSRRGRRRPATQADLEALSATVVDMMTERLAETLVANEIARLDRAPQLARQQIGGTRERLSEDVLAAIRAIGARSTAASDAASAALLTSRPDDASRFFADEARACEARADKVGAAESLHLEAALLSLIDPELALAPCRTAVSLMPDDALGWIRLGHLNLRAGLVNEAEAAFNEAHKAIEDTAERNSHGFPASRREHRS